MSILYRLYSINYTGPGSTILSSVTRILAWPRDRASQIGLWSYNHSSLCHQGREWNPWDFINFLTLVQYTDLCSILFLLFEYSSANNVHLSYNTFPIRSYSRWNGITVPRATRIKTAYGRKYGELLPPSFVHLDVQNDQICSFPLWQIHSAPL